MTVPVRPSAAARWAPPALVLAALLGSWQLATSALAIPPWLLPSPAGVLGAARAHAPELLRATALTGAAAAAGFCACLVVGVAIAVAFSQARWIERSLTPYTLFLQTVPIVAIAPLIILWSGTGFRSVVLVSWILGVFPVITDTTAGLTSVSREHLELFRLYRASRWQELVRLRLPHAIPHIVTGARNAAGLTVIGAIVGEFFAGYGARQHGLGYLVVVTSGQLRTDYLFSAIGASTALGLAIYSAVTAAGRVATARWRDVG